MLAAGAWRCVGWIRAAGLPLSPGLVRRAGAGLVVVEARPGRMAFPFPLEGRAEVGASLTRGGASPRPADARRV
jgi:hypothetical protein